MNFNVIDLFCGAGGMSLGFEKAGFDILLGVEFDRHIGNTYRRNHTGTELILDDIRNVSSRDILNRTGKSVGDIDCIIGGPPCQGFSSVGKRIVQDERNNLYKKYVEFVSEIRPKCFIMENVVGLTTMLPLKVDNRIMKSAEKDLKINHLIDIGSSNKIINKILNDEYDDELTTMLSRNRVHQCIIEDFENVGYKVISKIMKCNEYGVAQKRKRLIFIGIRNDLDILPTFPEPIILDERKQVTIGDAISDLSDIYSNKKSYPRTYYQMLMHGVISFDKFFNLQHKITEQNDSSISVIDTELLDVLDHDIKYLSDETIQKMIEHKKRHLIKGTGFGMRFFDFNKVGYTLTSHFNSNYEMLYPDKSKPRFFTIREAARIQGYPDDYIFYGTNTSKAKQIGNSVPVLFSYSIAKHVLSLLTGGS